MKLLLSSALAAALSLGAAPAHAGVYGDDLSKCLVASTSDADRVLLVKWIFSAMALNREISGYVAMPAEMRQDINARTAALYTRLLAESCAAQTRDAARYEGAEAIGNAFQLLGQVASQGIFSDPAVNAGMLEMTNLIDTAKLEAVIGAGTGEGN